MKHDQKTATMHPEDKKTWNAADINSSMSTPAATSEKALLLEKK